MTKRYSSIVFFIALVFQASATTHVITQSGTTWTPNAIAVNVGDIIQWQWTAGNHTTTSVSVPVGADTWDSPITSGNPTFEYTVEVAGTYAYVCTPHMAMGMAGGFVASGTSAVANVDLDAKPEMTTTVQNNVLKVQFSAIQPEMTTIRLIDMSGRELSVLFSDRVSTGELVITEDVAHYGRGIYLVQLKSGSFEQVTRIQVQ